MTKVSTTWLRSVCCLRKSGHWPAVNRKRTRPQHFQTSAVRKCAKRLFWPTLQKNLPFPHARQFHPISSALYMLPGLLLAHSDLMPMRFVDVDQRRSSRRAKNKPVQSRQCGQAGEADGWVGLGWRVGGQTGSPVPSTSFSSHIASARAGFHWRLSAELNVNRCVFCKEEGAGGVWPAACL